MIVDIRHDDQFVRICFVHKRLDSGANGLRRTDDGARKHAHGLRFLRWRPRGFDIVDRRLAQAAASYPTTRFLGVSPLYSFAFPAGISAYMAIAASSVWQYHRGGTVWKGRRFEATRGDVVTR